MPLDTSFAPVARPLDSSADAAVWRVRLLGGFEIDDGRHRLTRLRSRAAMALLARLAMAPARDHAREELTALLWPEADALQGRNRLRQTLSLLRAVLEPAGGPEVLLADRRVLRAVPGALWCDVTAFESGWRRAPPAQALSLYGGELLPGFFDEWVVEERQRLQAMADRLGDGRDGRAGRANPAEAATPPMPAVAARSAQTSAETGAEPTADATTETSAPSAGGGAARLPHYATRLIGAEAQTARLLALITRQRLVSVLGPGGAGKTRLAVEAARRAFQNAAQQPPGSDKPPIDHVVFVPLVGAFSRSELLDRLKMALRLGGGGDTMEQLLTALDGRATLLVLDNAEQLREGAVQAVAALLEQLPGLRCIVTSRRALELDGEQNFQLSALQLPAADAPLDAVAVNDAVALFVDRARAHKPDFHVSAGNHTALNALVRWLDGLPLAIELAAAQTRSLDPAETLVVLQTARQDSTAPAGSLAFLTRRGPRSSSDPRQASMLDVIAWSWHLLTPPQQRLLSALSLLPAGATLEAAAALSRAFDPPAQDDAMLEDAVQDDAAPDSPAAAAPPADPPPASLAATQTLLNQLQGSSVVRSSVGHDGIRRTLPLESVREFTLAQHDAPTLRRARGRMLAWLLDWALALPATPPLPNVREELPNLLQALAHAPADGDGNAALRLVLILQSSWGEIALPHSGLQLLDTLLASPGLDDSLAAGGHAMAAWCWCEAGQRDAARPHLQAAFDRPCSDPALQVMVLSRGARMHWRLDRDHVRARELIAQALPLARAVGRPNSEASLLSLQAHLCTVIDRDPAQATALSAQALALWQRSGNRHLINAGRYNVAVAATQGGRGAQVLDELQSLATEGLALQDWDLASGAFEARGTALLALRRWQAAASDLHQSLTVGWEGLQMVAVMYALWNVAPVLARLRHAALAAETMGLCEAQWPQRCGAFDPGDQRDLKRMRRFTRVLLEPDAAHAAWQRGASRALADGVRAVLALPLR